MIKQLARAALVLVLAVFTVSAAAGASWAWQTSTGGSLVCNPDGTITLTATFTNTEPDRPEYSMDVSPSGVSGGTKTVAPGETATWSESFAGPYHPGVLVKFYLRWTDGHYGTDTRFIAFQDVANCEDTTPTPTPTPTDTETPTPEPTPTETTPEPTPTESESTPEPEPSQTHHTHNPKPTKEPTSHKPKPKPPAEELPHTGASLMAALLGLGLAGTGAALVYYGRKPRKH